MKGRKKAGELSEKGAKGEGGEGSLVPPLCLNLIGLLDRCVMLMGLQEQSEKGSHIQVLYSYQQKDRSIPIPNSSRNTPF